MNETIERPLVLSQVADTLIEFGMGVSFLGRLSVERPDLCLRLAWGRLEAGYWQEEPLVMTGTRGLEPTANDWQRFVLLAAEIPKREGYLR